MKEIGSWSLARRLLISTAWIRSLPLLGVLIAAGYVFSQIHASQDAGVGAVGFGISDLMLVVIAMIWLGPPVVLIALWRARRARIISARSD